MPGVCLNFDAPNEKDSRSMQKKHCSISFKTAILALVFFTLAGCGTESTNNDTKTSSMADTTSTGKGAVSVSIAWPDHQKMTQGNTTKAKSIDCTEISTVEASIYANNQLVASGGPWPCDQEGGGVISGITPDPDYTVVIRARDNTSENNIVYRGEENNVRVRAGQNTHVEIDAMLFTPQSLSLVESDSNNKIQLTWNSVEGATGYELHISLQDNMENFESIDLSSPPPFAPLGLSSDTTYYWQLFARDIHGNSGVGSEIALFTTILGSPAPSFPYNNNNIADNQVTLTWDNLENITYRLYIATDPGMANLVVDNEAVESNSFTFADSEIGVDYYWQVYAVNENGIGNGSVIHHFSTFAGPSLLAPAADVILPREQIYFSWEQFGTDLPSQTPATYQLIVSKSSDMGDPIARIYTSAKSENTVNNEVANRLINDQTYFWSVLAYSDERPDGLASQTHSFKTLSKPQAGMPNDNSRVYQKPFDLTWNLSPNTNGYRIVISKNSDLGSPVVNATTTNNYFRIADSSNIDYGSTFFWRVYTIDTNDQNYETYATNIRSFNLFGVPELVTPEHRSYRPNGDFTLEWQPVENAIGYHIQVRQLPYTSDQYIDVLDEVIDNTTRFYIPPFTFKSDASGYWKVSAIDTNGSEGAFSGENRMTITDAIKVADINPSSETWYDAFPIEDDSPCGIPAGVDFLGYFFFRAFDGNEYGLYRTQGTPDDTIRIGDFRNPNNLTYLNGVLLFSAIPPGEDFERLYQMDSPQDTPDIVYNEMTGADEYWDDPYRFIAAYGGHLFLTQAGHGGTANFKRHIWDKFVGLDFASRIGFCDTYPELDAYPLTHIQTINGYRLFFSVIENPAGRDLRAIKYPFMAEDSTTLTTTQGPRYPTAISELDGNLIFFAKDASLIPNLWKSDGTVDGTSIIYNNISGPSCEFTWTSSCAKLGGLLYFWAKDPDAGHDYFHLWRTDGTPEGTEPLLSEASYRIRAGGHNPSKGPYIALMDNHLYFRRLNSDDELWKTDGESFQMVRNVSVDLNSSSSRRDGQYDFVLNLYGKIYFRANGYDPNNYDIGRVYVSEGAQYNTYQIRICSTYPCPGTETTGSSLPGIPVASGGGIYFPAVTGGGYDHNRELWRRTP